MADRTKAWVADALRDLVREAEVLRVGRTEDTVTVTNTGTHWFEIEVDGKRFVVTVSIPRGVNA